MSPGQPSGHAALHTAQSPIAYGSRHPSIWFKASQMTSLHASDRPQLAGTSSTVEGACGRTLLSRAWLPLTTLAGLSSPPTSRAWPQNTGDTTALTPLPRSQHPGELHWSCMCDSRMAGQASHLAPQPLGSLHSWGSDNWLVSCRSPGAPGT